VPAAANFDTANVASAKTVTATGLTLGGAAGNYTLSSTTAVTTADITAKTLTATVTAADKTYDATTSATINSCTLAGVLSGDTVTCAAGSATFASASVGTGKTVTATGITRSGGSAVNYALLSTTATTTAAISAATADDHVADAIGEFGYGTALSATQLNATASVPGTFVYTPATGVVLNAGVGQTLSVTFTPTDSTNYTTATGSVLLTVNKATPTITLVDAGSDCVRDPALGATQLNATASAPGTFVYTPPAGTVLTAGAGQTLSVTFTPTDGVNYTTATATVLITVNKVTPTITWPTPAAIAYGTALSATQLSATASVPGNVRVHAGGGDGPERRRGPDLVGDVHGRPTGANYTPATASVLLTVNKATPTTSRGRRPRRSPTARR